MPCRLRRCPSDWCHRSWARAAQERITRHLDVVGLGRGTVFFTVTAPGIVDNLDRWNRSTPRRFAALVRDLRQLVGALEYVRVLERQQRGALHVHAIATGWRRVDLESVRLLCVRNGFGPWFEVRPVRDLHAVAGYVASKYLTKSRDDIGRGYRVVQYSQGWAGPWRTTDEGADARAWAAALEAIDPTVAVLPDGMGWRAWADAAIADGQGEVNRTPEWDWRAHYGYVRQRWRPPTAAERWEVKRYAPTGG